MADVNAHAIARDRWNTLMMDVVKEDASPITSETRDELTLLVRSILGRMVHGADSPAEAEAFQEAEDRLLVDIEEEFIAIAQPLIAARPDPLQPRP